MISIAVIGMIISLGTTKVPPSGAAKAFKMNPWAEIVHGTKRLYVDRRLWITVIGISYFWFLGALVQMNILLLGKEVMDLDEEAFRAGVVNASCIRFEA